MVEIFGGIFAVLLILLVFLNLFTKNATDRLRQLALRGQGTDYRLPWPGGSAGYVVLALSDRLKIVQNQVTVFRGHYCEPTSSFVAYARDRYLGKREHLVFVIFEGGVSSFAEARSCLLRQFPNSEVLISWIVADKEVLKEVGENRFPHYVDTVWRGTELQ